jgi:hypothetical protein
MQNAVELEYLARQTWDRLRDGYDLDVSQGEETITDFNLLEIKRSGAHNIKVDKKTNKSEEAIIGIDWEWIIGSHTQGWLRYAVQAKKINVESNRYDSLMHKVNGVAQIDLLEMYAKRAQSIPLYCLYNYARNYVQNIHWQCGLPFQENLLGCTITPSSVIRQAINTWGKRRFDFIHEEKSTIPWRCLLTCPKILQIYSGGTIDIAFENVKVYSTNELSAIFNNLSDKDREILQTDAYPTINVNELIELSPKSEFSFGNRRTIKIIPQRTLIINIGDNLREDRLQHTCPNSKKIE